MAQHRLNYHHLISRSAVSTAGSPLVNAVVDAQSQLYYRYLPGFRRAYARVRRLSMLRYFLRKQGIRNLSLLAAVLPVLAANVPRYQVLSRSRVGPRYLEWWGERSRRQILQRYFGDAADDIGDFAAGCGAGKRRGPT
jgi:hypothetical protein